MTPYHWRTWLRERLPWRLLWLAPKRRRCPPGEHQWYRHDPTTWRCYHCRAERVTPDPDPRRTP